MRSWSQQWDDLWQHTLNTSTRKLGAPKTILAILRRREKPGQLECKHGEEHSRVKKVWVPRLSGGEKTGPAEGFKRDGDAKEREGKGEVRQAGESAEPGQHKKCVSWEGTGSPPCENRMLNSYLLPEERPRCTWTRSGQKVLQRMSKEAAEGTEHV